MASVSPNRTHHPQEPEHRACRILSKRRVVAVPQELRATHEAEVLVDGEQARHARLEAAH